MDWPVGRMEEQVMYERFTDRARKSMQLANQESQRQNLEYIAPEMILIGICKEGSGTACTILRNLGLLPEILIERTRNMITPGPEAVIMGKLPQTPAAKKVIEKTIEKAREQNHNYVGTEHMLLGLIDVESTARLVLTDSGLYEDRIKEELKRLLSGGANVEGINDAKKIAAMFSNTKQVPAIHIFRNMNKALDAINELPVKTQEWLLGYLMGVIGGNTNSKDFDMGKAAGNMCRGTMPEWGLGMSWTIQVEEQK